MNCVVKTTGNSGKTTRAGAHEEGTMLGTRWGKEHARPIELRRLDKARDPLYEWNFSDDDTSSAYSNFERFYFIIEPDRDGDRDWAGIFWSRHAGEDELKRYARFEGEFVHAFAEGALSASEELEPQT